LGGGYLAIIRLVQIHHCGSLCLALRGAAMEHRPGIADQRLYFRIALALGKRGLPRTPQRWTEECPCLELACHVAGSELGVDGVISSQRRSGEGELAKGDVDLALVLVVKLQPLAIAIGAGENGIGRATVEVGDGLQANVEILDVVTAPVE